jgi:hypothetical protein
LLNKVGKKVAKDYAKNGIAPERKSNNKTYSLVNQHGFDKEINVYDEESPFSVYNLIPDNAFFLKEIMKDVPEHFRVMAHYELRKKVKPSPTLNQLRLNFWAEYDRCLDGKSKIRTNNIIAGVCSRMVFRDYMKDPNKAAWLFTPVQSYTMGVQDVMETCLYKMRQGIENLPMDSVKDVNTILKIYEAFDKRVHGEYTQDIKKTVEYKGAPVQTEKQIEQKMRELGINNNVVEVYDESKGNRNE